MLLMIACLLVLTLLGTPTFTSFPSLASLLLIHSFFKKLFPAFSPNLNESLLVCSHSLLQFFDLEHSPHYVVIACSLLSHPH